MNEWYISKICGDCACIPVCSVYSATGGVAQCRYKVNKTLRGEWIYKAYDGDDELMLYHCSLCNSPSAQMHPYCRTCGAQMDMGLSMGDRQMTENICCNCMLWRTNRAIANLCGEGYGICDHDDMPEEVTFCSHKCMFCVFEDKDETVK